MLKYAFYKSILGEGRTLVLRLSHLESVKQIVNFIWGGKPEVINLLIIIHILLLSLNDTGLEM